MRWERLKSGWCKLSVDGCSMGNLGLSGVGGVIRDHDGNFRLGFSVPIGSCTNTYAEVMGFLFGLQNARHMGFNAIEIEMDSKLIIEWILTRRCGLWYLEDFWEEIVHYLDEITFTCSHIYRECNAVADSLAKLGAMGCTSTYYSAFDLPRETRGLLRLDKSSLPNLRRR